MSQARGGTSQSHCSQRCPTHLVQLGPRHILLVVGKDGVSPALQYGLGGPAQKGQAQIGQGGRWAGGGGGPCPSPT